MIKAPESMDDVHFRGAIYGNWVHIIGEADCGCLMDVEVQTQDGITFREAVNYFASQYVFGAHTEKHTDICLAAVPPELIRGETEIKVYATQKLGDLVRTV